MRISWERLAGHPATAWMVWATTRVVLLGSYSEYLSDVRFYAETAARAWGAGQSAYVDFFFPYAPLALGPIYLPRLGGPGLVSFTSWFHVEMLLVDLFCVVLLRRLAMRRLGLSPARTGGAVAVYCGLSLLMGHLIFDRLDLLIAASFLAALLWSPAGRNGPAHAAAAVAGILVKLIPLVWLPWTALFAWASGPRRRPAHALGAALMVLAPCLLVMGGWNQVTGGAVVESLSEHLDRGIQIESLWAVPFWAGFLMGEEPAPRLEWVAMAHDLSPERVPGWYAAAAHLVPPALLALFMVGLAVRVGTREPLDWSAVRSWQLYFTTGLALLVVAVATQRVLSPQYLIWLLAPLSLRLFAGGRRLEAILVTALYLLTWVEFDLGYPGLLRGEAFPVVALAARNLCLAILAGVLALEAFRTERGGAKAGL